MPLIHTGGKSNNGKDIMHLKGESLMPYNTGISTGSVQYHTNLAGGQKGVLRQALNDSMTANNPQREHVNYTPHFMIVEKLREGMSSIASIKELI